MDSLGAETQENVAHLNNDMPECPLDIGIGNSTGHSSMGTDEQYTCYFVGLC